MNSPHVELITQPLLKTVVGALSQTLSEELANRDILDNVSALGFLPIFAALLLSDIGERVPGAAAIAIGGGIAAVLALVLLRAANPIERSHLIETSD